MSDIPRPEYPRPSMVRERWQNLNGTWQFEIDRGDSGLERGLVDAELGGQITVPFCPESELSGIGDTDWMEAVWYRREIEVPSDWDELVWLHFGAVDHDATVWVNGTEVVRHRGGHCGFSAEISAQLTDGKGVVVVRARDPKHGPQARGKQSREYANHTCEYTRTTGIWQTVWLEPTPRVHLKRPVVVPQVAQRCFDVTVPVSANAADHRVRVTLSDATGELTSAEVDLRLDKSPTLRLTIPEDRVHLWGPGDGFLYDLRLELLAGDELVDAVDSYAGLRSVSLDGKNFLVNGKRVFQRLVLDQGYYRDGILTAPSDEALVRDIELSLEAGFNGARLHQKVFEERFLYHADRMGYLVWGEFPDWGAGGFGPSHDHQQPTASFITEWTEIVERDRSHPAIVGWCPLNETWQRIEDNIQQLDVVTHGMFNATKLADPTRPVLDASGYSHRVRGTEIWDSHDYDQNPATFAERHAGLADDQPYANTDDKGRPISWPYAGQPYFVSEYGGIWWVPGSQASGDDRRESWGYGERIRSEEEFHHRFSGLTNALLDDPNMFGYCYTQLTDVFQEENGIYRFDRTTKLDVERVREVQQRRAAYEELD